MQLGSWGPFMLAAGCLLQMCSSGYDCQLFWAQPHVRSTSCRMNCTQVDWKVSFDVRWHGGTLPSIFTAHAIIIATGPASHNMQPLTEQCIHCSVDIGD
jgi:hypothetical protein